MSCVQSSCARKKKKCSDREFLKQQHHERWTRSAVYRTRFWAGFSLVSLPKRQLPQAFSQRDGFISGNLPTVSISATSYWMMLILLTVSTILCTPFCSLVNPLPLISSTDSTSKLNTVTLILPFVSVFTISTNGLTLLFNADSSIFVSIFMWNSFLILSIYPNCLLAFSHVQHLYLSISISSKWRLLIFLLLDLDFHHSMSFIWTICSSMNLEIFCCF